MMWHYDIVKPLKLEDRLHKSILIFGSCDLLLAESYDGLTMTFH